MHRKFISPTQHALSISYAPLPPPPHPTPFLCGKLYEWDMHEAVVSLEQIVFTTNIAVQMGSV